MAAFGALFVVYWLAIIAVVLYVLLLATRFVRAVERIAHNLGR
jgi:hypothetical protein